MAEVQTFGVVQAQLTARFVLRADMAAASAAATGFGVALPEKINRASTSAGRVVMMLGPDEWLLLASDAAADTLEAPVLAALGGRVASLVEVSHRQIGLEVSGGAPVIKILNAAVPLDLSLAAFPVGMATRTIFDKAEIVLWRQGETQFHIEVWRSFAPYVAQLLNQFGSY